MSTTATPSNYDVFLQADFNRPGYFPLDQAVDPALYRPLADWIGRLILPTPEQRETGPGVLLELHHAPEDYQALVGRLVYLRWENSREVQSRIWPVARDVYFTQTVEKSIAAGLVHPERLRRWQLVTPLESLAGARPHDDVIVMLRGPVRVVPSTADAPISLYIQREPGQITGRYYALVQFIGPQAGTADLFRVVHFNKSSGQFNGPEEVIRLPETRKDTAGLSRSTSHGIETDPLNQTGWYISGAKNSDGRFVVQAIAPRDLLRLQPQHTVSGVKESIRYIKKQVWKETSAQKGKIASTLLSPAAGESGGWQEGDAALLVNSYGGIGGGREPYPYPGGYYFGHFSYGRAQVIREPLAGELQFYLEYYQVFSSNGDGLVPGVLHWTRYIGDRQFGYLGYRPVCDLLLKLDCFTAPYQFAGRVRSALERLTIMLEGTLHLYRIGGGTGGVFFGMANNCTQDSNQMLFASIQDMDLLYREHPLIRDMVARQPQEAARFERLLALGHALRRVLSPFGGTRADWRYNLNLVGASINESSFITVLRGLSSWRTITPHWASDAVAQVFLEHGASVWVLRTNQVGNYDPDMLPKAIDP